MTRTFHFIAIGGAVMHQLAIFLHQQGNTVSGSDDVIFDPARSELDRHGLLPDREGWYPDCIHTGIDAVILGMHAKADNPELERARELDLSILSFPEFIYERSKDKMRVAIAGSHGKTTVTSMILHVLQAEGLDFDYLVGARIDGFDTMVRTTETAGIIILEADEYLSSAIDRRSKFLHYRPHIAVITGIAWDHINVFPKFEGYLETFREFVRTMDEEGTLFAYGDDEHLREIARKCPAQTFFYHPVNARPGAHGSIVGWEGADYEVGVFGRHNMENLRAALLVCEALGVPARRALEHLSDFKGSARRMEKLAEDPDSGSVLYRDFAHAPSKLRATLAALREQYPGHQLIAAFELHTYSSLQTDFLTHYSGAMETADEAIVFLDRHALEVKGRDDIPDEVIRNAFNAPNLIVLRSAGDLSQAIRRAYRAPSVVALLSSGSFAGLHGMDLFDTIIVNS